MGGKAEERLSEGVEVVRESLIAVGAEVPSITNNQQVSKEKRKRKRS